MKFEPFNPYTMVISGNRIEVIPRLDAKTNRMFATAKVNDFIFEREVKSFADFAWVASECYEEYKLYLRAKV